MNAEGHYRHWNFASIEFDERSRRLTVDGRTVPIEAKPLALLIVLLEHAGDIVTKDELLDAVWPGLSVVEASIPTAVLKLRRALGDEKGDGRIIETVSRIGYRLAVPVEVNHCVSPPPLAPSAAVLGGQAQGTMLSPRRSLWAAGGLATALAIGTVGAIEFGDLREASPSHPPAQNTVDESDLRSAIRKLDVERIEGFIRSGWDPNTPMDKEGNGAVNVALQICEWNTLHDRERLVLLERTLFEAGAKLEHRNVWGDTAYSIAKAPRYCGPDHPVTKMLRSQCYDGYKPIGDKCLATYELQKRT